MGVMARKRTYLVVSGVVRKPDLKIIYNSHIVVELSLGSPTSTAANRVGRAIRRWEIKR
jgi:hypothetical protein